MYRFIFALVIAITVAGCATAPAMIYIRTDGQRSIGNPALSQQFEIDRTVCVGQASKADMSGTVIPMGGFAGLAQEEQRANEGSSVMEGCMADRGYLLVRADEAATQLEMAAIATEAKQKDMSSHPTAAPPVQLSPRRSAQSTSH